MANSTKEIRSPDRSAGRLALQVHLGLVVNVFLAVGSLVAWALAYRSDEH